MRNVIAVKNSIVTTAAAVSIFARSNWLGANSEQKLQEDCFKEFYKVLTADYGYISCQENHKLQWLDDSLTVNRGSCMYSPNESGKSEYIVDTIIGDGQKYVLNNPLSLAISKEDDSLVLSYEPLNIYAMGNSIEEALNDFHSIFTMLYKQYAEESDGCLTCDAIILKNNLKHMIKEVVAA